MRFLVMPLGVLALVGCASRESHIPLDTYATVPETASASSIMPSPPSASGYQINPLDELRIDVLGEPDLSIRELPVAPNGKINLPLVGEIDTEGQTTAELATRISSALNRYLVHPKVAVNVTAFTSQKVTVDGAVKAPGVFQALNDMTLMDAIALGQGLSDYSKEDQVLVFRRTAGQRYVARFDIGAIQTGEARDPTILPGDIVVVGNDASRRFFNTVVALLPTTVGIFVALIN